MARDHVERIESALQDAIFEGRYADGERLDETRLATQFGVSRTPVREALRRLSATGLVEQHANRGVFVRQPGPVDLYEMFQVMAELEAFCARLACSRIAPDTVTALRHANDACAAAADNNDIDTYYEANETFHRLIYDESGNAFLAARCRDLQKRLRPYRRTQLRAPGRLTQSLAEHAQVVDAIAAGQPDRAAAALRDHVSVQGEKFHRLMSAWRAVARTDSPRTG
ncbi:GntR family transcriptional regulator [Pararhodobacter marinus]|uniref:GntR family transcriptional regulator n=1 Tax=Pararhodobacter marinus TaxID=2184063 RepID=A0A2U2C7M5_9RHOB|nr:GntR family transcriptional regulator [Pararhodobacter marinus]PWE27880.1 GntR family transcriptional regulator [Pararhodobacter marinus]